MFDAGGGGKELLLLPPADDDELELELDELLDEDPPVGTNHGAFAFRVVVDFGAVLLPPAATTAAVPTAPDEGSGSASVVSPELYAGWSHTIGLNLDFFAGGAVAVSPPLGAYTFCCYHATAGFAFCYSAAAAASSAFFSCQAFFHFSAYSSSCFFFRAYSLFASSSSCCFFFC